MGLSLIVTEDRSILLYIFYISEHLN